MKNILGVLITPLSVMKSLNRGDVPILSTLLLLFAADMLTTCLLIPYISETISGSIGSNPQITEQQLPFIVGASVFVSSISPLFILAFVSILMLLAIMIFEGRASYKQVFTVLILASVPAVIARLGRAFTYIEGITSNPSQGITSIGFYLSDFPQWQKFLNAVDIFDLWTFVLVFIGIRCISGLKASQSYLITIFIWGGVQLVYYRAFINEVGV